MSIFEKRVALKPAEYPEFLEYKTAIQHSYWLFSEYNFSGDVQDFKGISEKERNALKNAMLAISQIEVSVKLFWSKLYDRMPKPEIAAVGVTFAESEVRHSEGYSHLLETLGFNEEFETLMDVPAIKDRVEYLTKYLEGMKSKDNRKFSLSVLLFSVFIENVSLFSQFLIMMSFNKHLNKFKGISNVIEATFLEENIHAKFGMALVNQIKKENPDWFDEDFEAQVHKACEKAYSAESKVLSWIFEQGELDFIPRNTVEEFIKNRFNNSLEGIGMSELFETDKELLKQTKWFEEELIASKEPDFFNKRVTAYSKKTKSFDEEDMF